MKPEQLTAWALHELSPEEQARIEGILRDDSDAQSQASQTREFCDFLTHELRDESLALDEEQRQELIRNAAGAGAATATPTKTEAAGAAPPRAWWRRPAVISLAAAAAVTIVGFLGLMREEDSRLAVSPSLTPPSAAADFRPPSLNDVEADPTRSQSQLMATTEPKTLKQALPLDGNFGRKRRLAEIPKELETSSDMLREEYAAGAQAGTGAAPNQKKENADRMTGNAAIPSNTHTGTSVTATQATLERTVESKEREAQAHASPTQRGLERLLADKAAAAPAAAGGQLRLNGSTATGAGRLSGTLDVYATTPADKTLAAPMIATATPAAAPASPSMAAPPAESRSLAGAVILSDSNMAPAPTQPERAVGLSIVDDRQEQPGGPRLLPPHPWPPGPPPPPHPYPTPRPHPTNTESYTRIVENSLTDVVREPLSTFSIDVDTAAYANVRRFLNQNTAPPRDAVRIEELINYFPANEEAPAAGANEPFAVRVEMAPCPWQPQHRLARIAVKGRELGMDRKASNLVFLVDVSGSMDQPNKLPLVKQSLRLLVEKLGEGDKVAMVTYAGGTSVVLPPTHGDNKREIMAAIDRLQPGGSTHGSAGIQLAYQEAVSGFIQGGVNRVILCTDGDFNVGVSSPEELETLITEKARSGVFLSVLGYGAGNLKDRTMETLADKGNGNYAYIDSLSEARKVLVEQMSGTLVTIAKDVKIQVEFNPAIVRSYRLIGYENRMLAKEDFNDDRKDAGEIGAGHSVTALYEIVPSNLPPGTEPRPAVDGLKYQTQPATPPPAILAEPAHSGEAMTVKLRYKEPDGSASKLIEVPVKDDGRTLAAASGEFKFTAAVAGFGLLLRDSSYAGQLTWEQVRQLAIEGKGNDTLGYRGEFVQLVEKARGVRADWR